MPETTPEELIAAATKQRVPLHLAQQLVKHVFEFTSSGDFFDAVLSNDLRLAMAHGDVENVKHLQNLIKTMHCRIPGSAWGSRVKVKAWRRGKGETKLLRVNLSAYTHLRWTGVVKVPVDADQQTIVNTIEDYIQSDEYELDTDVWDRGACMAELLDGDEMPEFQVLADHKVTALDENGEPH